MSLPVYKLVLRNLLSEKGGKRSVELFVAPQGNIRYTVDGANPVRASSTKSQLRSATATFFSVPSVRPPGLSKGRF